MRRKFVITIMIIVCYILESTIFRHFKIASVTPNILLILTVSFGVMRGSKEGMIIGFVSGLLLDIFFCFGSLFGFYALLFTLVGYLNGLFHRMFFSDDIKLPLVLIAVSELLFGIFVYIFMFMMRSKFNFSYYFKNIILPELVYTVIISLILYPIILKVNQKLETEEKRSASKFV